MECGIQIPGETKDRIVRGAYERIEALKARDLAPDRVLAEVTAWLMEQEEVQDTKGYGKTDLTVWFVDGTQIAILLGRRHLYGPLTPPPAVKGGGAAGKPDPG